jgi:hypothetical protein
METIKNHVREVLGEGPLLVRALKPRPFMVPLGVALAIEASRMSTCELETLIESDKQLIAAASEEILNARKISVALMESELKTRGDAK